jgi:hypothetical protein
MQLYSSGNLALQRQNIAFSEVTASVSEIPPDVSGRYRCMYYIWDIIVDLIE